MEQEVNFDPNPANVPPDARTFVGKSGKVYKKADSISANRYKWMEILNIELAYGRTPKEMFDNDKKAFELLNKQEFARAAVLIDQNMSGVAKIADGKEHAMIRMAMLFWNYEGEDTGLMTEELMAEKVADTDHINVGFFFGQAVSNASGLLAAYRESSQASSGEERK